MALDRCLESPIRFARLQAPSPEDVWFVGTLTDADGQPVDASRFTRGQIVPEAGALRLRIEEPGRIPDFSFGAFGLPVARAATGAALAQLAPAAIQLVPVGIVGVEEPFVIVNVVARLAAIDPTATVGGRRADGQGWLYVAAPAVDPSRAANAPLFRLDEFSPMIIVAEPIRQALEAGGWTGFEWHAVLSAPGNAL